MPSLARFPEIGMSRDAVLAQLREFRDSGADWRGGRVPIFVFHADTEVEDISRDAFDLFFSENAQGGSAFPGVDKMLGDVTAAALDLLSAPPEAQALMTSGGTESIFVAVQCARDRARATGRGDTGRHRIVLPLLGPSGVRQGGAISGPEDPAGASGPRSRRGQLGPGRSPGRRRGDAGRIGTLISAGHLRPDRRPLRSRAAKRRVAACRRLCRRLSCTLRRAAWAIRCRTSTSRCRASPRSRQICTNTATPQNRHPQCCSAAGTWQVPPSSASRPGHAASMCRAASRAPVRRGRWPRPGQCCITWEPRATSAMRRW